ncbi:lysozyme inhibitor LprI family protein [Lichenifustis flavocetrariae]|uniref:Lysozyme inhibitor LprI N-terminal domain-containing protein n=1 Tax=Lichenifustis flavocetrariae TaxID=2949735 RepID=A0AA41Z576_9HYPH|nr:hypothetical protein [Lichenifustis flavocetrariae]MCW6509507.1 hypothetical protein [Lichenifustis flavocetrariae]
MRFIQHLFAAGFLLGGLTQAVAAPDGFIDCAKAATVDEKAICADIKLVQDDARMVTLYKVAMGLAGMGVRGDLQDGQSTWLEHRHTCKDDTTCLRTTYAARIERLQKVIDAVAARGPF